MSSNNNKKLMTPQEVADLLGVSAQTIKNWEEAGILRSFKGGLRSKFFSRTYIEKFVDELDNLNEGEKLLRERKIATNKANDEYNLFLRDLVNRDPYTIHRFASMLSTLLLFTTEMYSEELSDVDKYIIERIAGFKSSYEIAEEFGCSNQRIHQLFKTVENHMQELTTMQNKYREIEEENKRLKAENKQLVVKLSREHMPQEEETKIDILSQHITEFGFSNRLIHILGKHKIRFMYELINFDPRKLWITRNFGMACAKEIEDILNKYGLKFNNAPQGVYTKFVSKDFKNKSLRKEIDYALSV